MPSLKIWLVLFLLSFSSAEAANLVCLNARSTNDPSSGHSFVTVETPSGRILEAYGLWPTSKYPASVAINFTGDYPIEFLKKQKQFRLPQKLLEMGEDRLCLSMRVDRKTARAKVTNYLEEYGPYRTLNNNCNHFAIRIFNFAAQVEFPLVTTPKRTRKIIRNANQ